MIEFIIDIFNQLVDLYQHFFGIPEGITYALFGSRKKKKAKKALANAQQQIDSALANNNQLDNIQSAGDVGIESTELVTDGDVIPGTDTLEVPFIPSFPYDGKQIILNSGRLHLNAKDDFIILNSKKSISLAAPGSINIDTEGAFVVNAQKIRLGIGDRANHPLVYGDELIDLFTQINQQFQLMSVQLKGSEDSTGAPITGAKSAAKTIEALVKIIDSKLSQLNSTRNFTQ